MDYSSSIVTERSNDFITEQKKNGYYNSIILMIVSAILLYSAKDQVLELLELEPGLKLFIAIDFLLYIIYIIWFNIMKINITDATLNIH